jgi:hypothetical protein
MNAAIHQMIVRRVKVDRTRTPKEAVAATKRNEYVDQSVLATAPAGELEEVDVYFYPIECSTSAPDFAKLYDELGLVPDPMAQTAVNEDDPAFADNHPNGSQWKDSQNRFCYLAFRRWDGERDVNCYRYVNAWNGRWFVAGVRK